MYVCMYARKFVSACNAIVNVCYRIRADHFERINVRQTEQCTQKKRTEHRTLIRTGTSEFVEHRTECVRLRTIANSTGCQQHGGIYQQRFPRNGKLRSYVPFSLIKYFLYRSNNSKLKSLSINSC